MRETLESQQGKQSTAYAATRCVSRQATVLLTHEPTLRFSPTFSHCGASQLGLTWQPDPVEPTTGPSHTIGGVMPVSLPVNTTLSRAIKPPESEAGLDEIHGTLINCRSHRLLRCLGANLRHALLLRSTTSTPADYATRACAIWSSVRYARQHSTAACLCCSWPGILRP